MTFCLEERLKLVTKPLNVIWTCFSRPEKFFSYFSIYLFFGLYKFCGRLSCLSQSQGRINELSGLTVWALSWIDIIKCLFSFVIYKFLLRKKGRFFISFSLLNSFRLNFICSNLRWLFVEFVQFWRNTISHFLWNIDFESFRTKGQRCISWGLTVMSFTHWKNIKKISDWNNWNYFSLKKQKLIGSFFYLKLNC